MAKAKLKLAALSEWAELRDEWQHFLAEMECPLPFGHIDLDEQGNITEGTHIGKNFFADIAPDLQFDYARFLAEAGFNAVFDLPGAQVRLLRCSPTHAIALVKERDTND